MTPIPYGRQDINASDISAVVEVLKSDFLTQGPTVPLFEKALAFYCGVKHAVAVSNATAALHLGCLALGIKAGERVWTSPNTFVASSNAALYLGAEVDFVDIDPVTYNLSIPALEAKLRDAKKLGRLPQLLIPVHHSGQSCDMKRIHELSLKYGFRVMEDASHAVGGAYAGRKIGSCQFSDLTVFSFHPVKIVTTGEGGAILTNNDELYEALLRLRSHGITRDSRLMSHEPDGPWYYQQIELGFNYRMTDIQAALGVNQMQRIDDFVKLRHQIAARYEDQLKNLPITLPIPSHQGAEQYSALHLYVVRAKLNRIGKTQKKVFEELHQRGVMVNLHYIPVYTQPYYLNLGFKKGICPEAELYYGEAISLPMYSALTVQEQNRVISALQEVLG